MLQRARSRTQNSATTSRRLIRTPAAFEDEIERKFRLTPDVRARLARLAAPSLRSTFTDRYFDSRAYELTSRDLWLRRRDAVWELKSPQPQPQGDLASGGLEGVDFYRETRDWPTIAATAARLTSVRLAPPFPSAGAAGEEAEAWLAARGVALFANVVTVRERRSLELARGHRVRLDLDAVSFLADDNATRELSRYDIGEVELVAAGGEMSSSAALADVFEQLGIGIETVRGKLLELLTRHRPEHYEALRKSGLLATKLGRRH